MEGKIKILLVDDELDILRLVGKRLQNAGYEVVPAAGGEQALALLEAEEPQLVLLDISMPGMDGFEVCSRIKQKKKFYDLPVIFFTARGSVEDKITGLKHEVNDYITKPIDHRELLARIESALAMARRYGELSGKDELTGLYNYNYFEKEFSHMFEVAHRYGRIFSLIIVDVNDLKRVNDTYGHLCGNAVLKAIARKLECSLRKVDILARYGGDEFVILLPETNSEQAPVVLKKFLKTCGSFRVAYQNQYISGSASFGCATYSVGLSSKEALFNEADKDMYVYKKRRKREKSSGH